MSRRPGGVSPARRVRGRPSKRLTSAHHARRLASLGRSAQRTPPDDGREWAAGDPSPRAGNALDVLIEGAAYLPALEHAIRDARCSVLIAGWCFTPGFALVRDELPVLLRELLRPPASASRSAARKMPGPQ
jgi:phosphatidylserine/phosphatidylglycerophosphate/cardiolipin synthase-like enzyme